MIEVDWKHQLEQKLLTVLFFGRPIVHKNLSQITCDLIESNINAVKCMCDEHPLSHLLPQTIVISRLLFFLHRHYHCHCRFFGQPCCQSLVPLLTCTMFFTFIFSLYLSNVQCSVSVSDSDSERVNHINHSRNVDAHYAKTEYIE